MRKLFFSLTLLVTLGDQLCAQISKFLKKPSLSISIAFDDFTSAGYIHDHDLRDAINNQIITNFQNLGPGLAVGYIQGLAKHFDFAGMVSANATGYPSHANPGTFLGQAGSLLVEADASLVGKMLSDRHFFTPFLKAGIGASEYQGYIAAFLPLGVGFQFRLNAETFALLNWQYRAPLTPTAYEHFFYSAGVAGNIGGRWNKPALLPLPSIPLTASKDRDGDGIVDSLDACPDLPGLAKFKGCPDSDGDGVPDNEDKCPTVAGLARYHGCPIPDSDGDGINDEEDRCPTVAGLARYQGCPIPDSDGDGINDEEDKCPYLPGEKENQGCPVVKAEITDRISQIAKNIFFASGSVELLPKSLKPLIEVVDILKENEGLKLDIEAYSDDLGDPEQDRALSLGRARTVMAYIRNRAGISENRLTATGYGGSKPFSSNQNAQGRALNRRVEMKAKYY